MTVQGLVDPRRQDYEKTMLWAAAINSLLLWFHESKGSLWWIERRFWPEPASCADWHGNGQQATIDHGAAHFKMLQNKSILPRSGHHASNNLCPIKALLDYLKVKGGALGLLLMQRDGSPPYVWLLHRQIQAMITVLNYTNPTRFSGHSFRGGGAATTVAAMNVEDSIIKTLGRSESTA